MNIHVLHYCSCAKYENAKKVFIANLNRPPPPINVILFYSCRQTSHLSFHFSIRFIDGNYAFTAELLIDAECKQLCLDRNLRNRRQLAYKFYIFSLWFYFLVYGCWSKNAKHVYNSHVQRNNSFAPYKMLIRFSHNINVSEQKIKYLVTCTVWNILYLCTFWRRITCGYFVKIYS